MFLMRVIHYPRLSRIIYSPNELFIIIRGILDRKCLNPNLVRFSLIGSSEKK